MAEAGASDGRDEVAECDMLRLVVVGDKQVLRHAGTGESVVLEGHWQLLRDEAGRGILVCDQALGAAPTNSAPKWAAQLLKLRIEKRMNCDTEALAVLEGDHLLGWQSDLKRSDRTSMAFHARRLDNGRPFVSECVVCRFAPAGQSVACRGLVVLSPTVWCL